MQSRIQNTIKHTEKFKSSFKYLLRKGIPIILFWYQNIPFTLYYDTFGGIFKRSVKQSLEKTQSFCTTPQVF